MTTPKSNLKLSKKFKNLFEKLPSEELLQFIETQNKIEHWFIARKVNKYKADCFASRFAGKDDPIEHLKKTENGKLIHRFTWQSVDTYESLWAMTQISFSDVKQICAAENISLPFSRAWDLFLEIISFQEDAVYAKCLQESCNTIHLKRDSQAAKLIRKSAWDERGKLNEAEDSKLKELTKDQPINNWLVFTYNCCQQLSKRDELIAKHYNKFRRDIATTMDLQQKVFSDSSKGRLDIRFASIWWIDGNEYRGQEKGGMILNLFLT